MQTVSIPNTSKVNKNGNGKGKTEIKRNLPFLYLRLPMPLLGHAAFFALSEMYFTEQYVDFE